MPVLLLALGPEEDAKIKELVEFAARPENHYKLLPGVDSTPPGLDPRFSLQLGVYRCVFSHTVTTDKTYRHLSVSLPDPFKYPHPVVVETIATQFGFTGKLTDWGCMPNEEDKCIVVVQPL